MGQEGAMAMTVVGSVFYLGAAVLMAMQRFHWLVYPTAILTALFAFFIACCLSASPGLLRAELLALEQAGTQPDANWFDLQTQESGILGGCSSCYGCAHDNFVCAVCACVTYSYARVMHRHKRIPTHIHAHVHTHADIHTHSVWLHV